MKMLSASINRDDRLNILRIPYKTRKEERARIYVESLSVFVEWPASLYRSRRWGFLFKGIKGCFADMAIFFKIFHWRHVLIGLDYYYVFIVY